MIPKDDIKINVDDQCGYDMRELFTHILFRQTLADKHLTLAPFMAWKWSAVFVLQ